MSLSKLGLHTQGIAYMQELLATGARRWVILDPDAELWLPAIFAAIPDAQVCVRWYTQPTVRSRDPAFLGWQAAQWWLSGSGGNADPRVHIVLANELNLNYEFGADQAYTESELGWREQGRWLIAAHRSFKANAPTCILHMPANSPNHGADEPDGRHYEVLPEMVDARLYCQFQDVHAYWKASGSGLLDADKWWDSALRWARMPGHGGPLDPGGIYHYTDLPIWITECNEDIGPDAASHLHNFLQFLSLYPRVDCAVWFLGNTFPGSGHSGYVILPKYPELLQAMKNIIAEEETVGTPEELWNDPRVKQWFLDGGWTQAQRWLAATRQMPITPEMLEYAKDDAASLIEEVFNLGRLPNP